MKNEPYVEIYFKESIFEISGNSYSEGIARVYKLILKRIDREIHMLKDRLICKFHFSIINSISHRGIMEIIMKLCEYRESGKDIEILWIFDKSDEDIKIIADDIKINFAIPIKIIEYVK